MRLDQVKVGMRINARRAFTRTRDGGSIWTWEADGTVTKITTQWRDIRGVQQHQTTIYDGDRILVEGRSKSYQARHYKPLTPEQLDAAAYWEEVKEIDRINRENGVPMLRWTGDGYASNNPLRAVV